jgi:hypothetical protein
LRYGEKYRVPLLRNLVATGQQILKKDRNGLLLKDLTYIGRIEESTEVAVVEVAFADEIWSGDGSSQWRDVSAGLQS